MAVDLKSRRPLDPRFADGKDADALRTIGEVSQALVIVAIVVVLAAAFGAPLGERANPGMSPNPAKAPWYFMGVQELLFPHGQGPTQHDPESPVEAIVEG